MTGKGCILIHGFTGSPKEVELLTNHLEKKGFDVDAPFLAGHDYFLNRRQMSQYSWLDWVKTAEDALTQMLEKHNEVYLIGFSMGGIISAYLATKYPIKKLVLLSASVFYTNPKQFVTAIRKSPLTKQQLKRYIQKFRATPLKATINFRKLVKELKPYINNINVPVLIIQGEMDDIVVPKSAQYIYDNVQSTNKHLHFLPKSKHVVCLDCEQNQVLELVNNFID